MQFCPNCNNVFDITKSSVQNGGLIDDKLNDIENVNLEGGAVMDNYDEIIRKIIDNETISKNNLDKVSLDELTKSIGYKKLKYRQREYIFNKLQDLLPIEKKKIVKEQLQKQQMEKAFYICKNCGYLKQIEEGTLIFSKVSPDIAQSYTTTDLRTMASSDILPITRKYICPNDKCESQHDLTKREASFFRLNNSFRIKYICLACKTAFTQ